MVSLASGGVKVYSDASVPPVDGAWSAWGEWGSCTQTCDDAVRSRTRSCVAAASLGRQVCPSVDLDQRADAPCNVKPCGGLMQTS